MENPTSMQFAGISLLVDFNPQYIGIVSRHIHNVIENHQGPMGSLVLAAVCCCDFVQIVNSSFRGVVVQDHLWFHVMSLALSDASLCIVLSTRTFLFPLLSQ